METLQTSEFSDGENKDRVNPSVFREGNSWRIVVDLNEACNIKCSYCHIDALFGVKARNSRVMSPLLVGSILRDADQMQVFDVTLTGGEITILPNLTDYLEVVKDLRFSSVQVITNGTLLSKNRARDLKALGIQRVSISIDSLEESNDQARGKGVWRKAWKGLENAIAAGLAVNVISVLGNHNIDDWYRLSVLLKDIGVRTQNISLMCRLGRAESAEKWLGVPEDRLDEVTNEVRELQDALNDSNFFISFNDGVMKAPGWSGAPTPIHSFQDQNPGIEAVIKVDGRVLRNRLYGKNNEIGNLSTATLSSLWHRDVQKRKQLVEVVGEDNVGLLPKLYYNYSASGQQSSKVSAASAEFPHQSGDIRVRHEKWGTIKFDRQTFSIVDIQFKTNPDE